LFIFLHVCPLTTSSLISVSYRLLLDLIDEELLAITCCLLQTPGVRAHWTGVELMSSFEQFSILTFVASA
jgi:hypothetical protein